MNIRSLVYRSFGHPEEVLQLETKSLCPRKPDLIRVKMHLVPVNPSDLVPITGAYAHRITLPAIAGYEGVGRVIEAPAGLSDWIGRRVLPLRGPGTWQSVLDCVPDMCIPVPEHIDDLTAARAYINPLAALTLIEKWDVRGKQVLLSGAGSTCADLIGFLALRAGAAEVVGLYRSEARVDRMRALGLVPVSASDLVEVDCQARDTDIVFDALGGPVGSRVLDGLRRGSDFVGYGLLTGETIRPTGQPRARVHRFHLRDTLATMSATSWQKVFDKIWDLLVEFDMPIAQVYAFDDWRQAIGQTRTPGKPKPLLQIDA